MSTTIRIPVDVILAHTPLSWDDVRFGLEMGFIDSSDVVTIAKKYEWQKNNVGAIEAELATLQPDETRRIAELVGMLASIEGDERHDHHELLCLILAWLYEQRESFDDSLAMVERIYADFEYPEFMSCFVRYMPPSDDYRPQDHTSAENRNRIFGLGVLSKVVDG